MARQVTSSNAPLLKCWLGIDHKAATSQRKRSDSLLDLRCFSAPIAAIVQILEYLNIRPHFNPDVRYDAESGCAQRFQQAEYFARQNNLRNFNGVSQTSFDTNHLVLAATSQSAENLGIFATQYQQTPTVTLTGSEADVIQAAMTFARKQYNVQGGQLGGTSAVVRKFDQHIGGNPIRTFSTACGVLYCTTVLHPMANRTVKFCLHIPGVTDTRNLPAITLTA